MKQISKSTIYSQIILCFEFPLYRKLWTSLYHLIICWSSNWWKIIKSKVGEKGVVYGKTKLCFVFIEFYYLLINKEDITMNWKHTMIYTLCLTFILSFVSVNFAEEEGDKGNMFYMVMIKVKPGMIDKFLELYEKRQLLKIMSSSSVKRCFTIERVRNGQYWLCLNTKILQPFKSYLKEKTNFTWRNFPMRKSVKISLIGWMSVR